MNSKINGKHADDSRRIDPVITFVAIGLTVAFAAAVFLAPDSMNKLMTNLFGIVNNGFGWIWLLACFGSFILCIWLAFGRYGKMRFGEDKPDTSTFLFYGNLFVAGSSASLVYWVFLEFFLYLEGPPYGAEPFSTEALIWASAYGPYHWGIVPFSTFALMGVMYAFFFYVRKQNTASVASACASLIGEKNANGMLGKVIDCVALFCIIVQTAGYSLGVSVPIIGTFAQNVFGINHNLLMDAVILFLLTLGCAAAMYTGLNKGMTLMNNIRFIMFFGVLIYVTIVGPTGFIFNNTVESMGTQIQNLVRMSTYTSSADASGWSAGWTMFFNVMFLAGVVIAGLYYGRLCKGRTMRQCVIAICVASGIGSGVFFWTMGNYSIATYLGDPAMFKALFHANPYDAIIYVLESLPFSKFIIVLFMIYAFLATWTCVQGSIYTEAMIAQPNLPYTEEPSKMGRLGWCVATGVLCFAFMCIGGLQMVKNATVIAGAPTCVLMVLVVVANLKDMKKYWGPKTDEVKVPETFLKSPEKPASPSV